MTVFFIDLIDVPNILEVKPISFSNKMPKTHRLLANIGSVVTFFAASIGVPVERTAKATGVSPADLMNPDGRIPQEFFLKFLRLLAKVRPGKNVSLDLARAVPFSLLGSPGRLISQSPDLRSVLELTARNSDLFVDLLEAELFQTATEAIFRMHHPFDDIDDGLGGEFCIGLSARIIREDFGDGLFARVQFRHAPRSPAAVYEAFFGVPVSFQAEFNALVLLPEALDRPNKKARLEMQDSLEQHLAHLRQDLGMGEADRLANVREAIAHNAMKGDYTVSGLARRLAMDIRTLQRRLKASGISARILLDEARYANALELLANERISIEEAASRLGFNSEGSFRKAFLRRSKKSPAQVRREIRKQNADNYNGPLKSD